MFDLLEKLNEHSLLREYINEQQREKRGTDIEVRQEEVVDAVEDAVEDVADAVVDVVEGAGDVVEDVAEDAADAAEDVAEVVADVADEVVEGAGDAVTGVVGVVDDAGEAVGNLAGAAGDLVGNLIQVLTNSTTGMIDTFTDVVQEVGEAIEEVGLPQLTNNIFYTISNLLNCIINYSCVTQNLILLQNLPPSVWNAICLATWWPLQQEHCETARCVACSPAITTSAAVCKKAGLKLTHKCIEEVMGEGSCNFCIKEYLKF